jgi:hypothetical protein
MAYRCPNGHDVARVRVIACDEPGCQANVVYEPSAHGIALGGLLRAAEQALTFYADAGADDGGARARIVLRAIEDR